jgi:hypothetical protein
MMADTDVLFQAEPFSVHTIGDIRFDSYTFSDKQQAFGQA